MLFCSFIMSLAFAQTERLSQSHANLSKVQAITISPGLVSVLEFPQNIIEVRVGNPRALKVAISQVSPKELTLFLTSSNAGPSNLIVRADKKIYVFDVIPSKVNHQDYLKIRGGYSSPDFVGRNIQSSEHGVISPTSKINKSSSPTMKNSKVMRVGP